MPHRKTKKKERVLVFVQFPDMIAKVAEALKASGTKFLEIKGGNTSRSKALESFQDGTGDEKVLLMNIGGETASGA